VNWNVYNSWQSHNCDMSIKRLATNGRSNTLSCYNLDGSCAPAITRAWLTDNSQKPTCWCHAIRSNLRFINNNGSVKPCLVQAALDCPVFYRPHCTIEQPVWYAVNSSGLARACIVVLLLVTTQLTCMRCKVRCKSWCLHVNRSM